MRIRIVAIGMLLLLSAALTAAVQNGNDLYQQGLARETAGDIKGGIQIFERIVRDFSSNRTLAARALVQLGRWSDVLGQDQARKYYERVTREFADQKDAAAEARARLDVLTKVAAPGASPARRLAVDWANWTRRINSEKFDARRAPLAPIQRGATRLRVGRNRYWQRAPPYLGRAESCRRTRGRCRAFQRWAQGGRDGFHPQAWICCPVGQYVRTSRASCV